MNFNVVGDEAVEVDIGAHLIAEIAVVVKRVDLEDLHDKLGDIFKMKKESDFVIEAVDFLAGGVELDIDAIFEGLEF